MTRIRRDDTSALPAQARGSDGHSHPLPMYVRVTLVMFALALAGAFASVVLLALSIEARIDAKIDRRTEIRDAQQVRTNELICRVLTVALVDSPEAAELADNLNCK